MLGKDQKLAGARFLPVWRRKAAARAGLGYRRARHGVVGLEFALLSIPFFMFVLFVFELSYDLFTQEVLDYALQRAVAHTLARGNAANLTDGSGFIDNFLCKDFGGLLACNGAEKHIYVKVQKFTAATQKSGGTTDYFDITTGKLPMAGNVLDLSSYLASSSFCNAGSDQFVLVSVIYVGPTFVGYLLPNIISVTLSDGSQAHATLATAGINTERFSISQTQGSAGICS